MKKKIIKKEEVLPAIEHKISAIEKACHFIVKPITKPRRKYDRKAVMRKAMLKYGIPALLLFVINTNSDAFFMSNLSAVKPVAYIPKLVAIQFKLVAYRI